MRVGIRAITTICILLNLGNWTFAEQSPVIPLETGQSADRTLKAAETDSFEILLSPGDFLRFSLEHASAGLIVRLTAPNGDALISIDDTRQHETPVMFSHIAAVTGRYRLSLRVSPGKPESSYTLRLRENRPSRPYDRKSLEAEKALREGRILLAAATGASRKAALPKFETAAALAKESEDTSIRMNALRSTGRVLNLLGDSPRAIAALTVLLDFARALGEKAIEAEALNNLGLENVFLGNYQQAIVHLTTAVQMWNELGKPESAITPNNNLALAYVYQGDLEMARQAYEESAHLLEGKDDKVTLGFARAGIASVFLLQGNYQAALDHYGRAAALWHEAGNGQNETTALGNMGTIYLHLGEPELAQRKIEQALSARRALGDKAGEANAVQNLGDAYQMLGQPQKALAHFEQGASLFESVGRRADQATVFARMGALEDRLGQRAEALLHFERAQSLSHEIGDRRIEAIARLGLARLALEGGNLPETFRMAEEALQLTETGGFRPEQEGVLVCLARAELASGHLDNARRRMEVALEIAESIRASIAGADFRRSYFAGVRNRYDLLIDILMRQQLPAEAFAVSERARSRSLLELLSETRSGIENGVDPQLLRREKQLRAALRVKISAPEAQVRGLVLDYREVTNEIRSQSPRYAALIAPEPLSLADVQSGLLDDETVLLEYALGEEHSYVWAVTKSSVSAHRLPSRAIVEAAARAAYLEMSARQGTGQVQILSRMLLGPVEKQLGHKRLAVVSEGSLQYIPFAALLTAGGEPLVTGHEIVSLPSASTLGVLRQQVSSRPMPKGSVAVFGDPVFTRDDPRVNEPASVSKHSRPEESLVALRSVELRSAQDAGLKQFDRLPSTRSEAEAIAGFAGKSGRSFLDFDATREAAISPDTENYRILHFATHGLLDNRHPELSGLVFSLVDRQGHPKNGFLQAFEIYNLRLSAELVVLSACQTAIGSDIRGEGLLGLSRGFMYAGAPRVVASLWKVPDLASAELMKRFYRGMMVERKPPAAALRAAQAELRSHPRTADPFYWAGFVLQGEWK